MHALSFVQGKHLENPTATMAFLARGHEMHDHFLAQLLVQDASASDDEASSADDPPWMAQSVREEMDKLRAERTTLLNNPPANDAITKRRREELPVFQKVTVAIARQRREASAEARCWHYYELVGALAREIEELREGAYDLYLQRLRHEEMERRLDQRQQEAIDRRRQGEDRAAQDRDQWQDVQREQAEEVAGPYSGSGEEYDPSEAEDAIQAELEAEAAASAAEEAAAPAAEDAAAPAEAAAVPAAEEAASTAAADAAAPAPAPVQAPGPAPAQTSQGTRKKGTRGPRRKPKGTIVEQVAQERDKVNTIAASRLASGNLTAFPFVGERSSWRAQGRAQFRDPNSPLCRECPIHGAGCTSTPDVYSMATHMLTQHAPLLNHLMGYLAGTVCGVADRAKARAAMKVGEDRAPSHVLPPAPPACETCGGNKPAGEYSSTQRKKPPGTARCKSCIAAERAWVVGDLPRGARGGRGGGGGGGSGGCTGGANGPPSTVVGRGPLTDQKVC
jgi:hypothetical protein